MFGSVTPDMLNEEAATHILRIEDLDAASGGAALTAKRIFRDTLRLWSIVGANLKYSVANNHSSGDEALIMLGRHVASGNEDNDAFVASTNLPTALIDVTKTLVIASIRQIGPAFARYDGGLLLAGEELTITTGLNNTGNTGVYNLDIYMRIVETKNRT